MTKRRTEFVRNPMALIALCRGDIRDKIEGFSIPVPESGCWLWIGNAYSQKYPIFRVNGVVGRANRISYEAFKGVIPPGMLVCHKCDTPSCVNPEHLYAGTAKQNAYDRDRKGRANSPVGPRHGMCRLTWEQVTAIRNDMRVQRQIAADFGISQAMVSHIKLGKKRALA